jgi:hypothetical protein
LEEALDLSSDRILDDDGARIASRVLYVFKNIYITVVESVYFAVRNGTLYKADYV